MKYFWIPDELGHLIFLPTGVLDIMRLGFSGLHVPAHLDASHPTQHSSARSLCDIGLPLRGPIQGQSLSFLEGSLSGPVGPGNGGQQGLC